MESYGTQSCEDNIHYPFERDISSMNNCYPCFVKDRRYSMYIFIPL